MSTDDTLDASGLRASASLPFADAPGTHEVVGYCQYAPLAASGGPEVTLASMLCYAQGWRLVVMAKASFRLDTSPMEPAEAPPIVVRDATRRGNPVASLAAASDMVPGRTRVDVTAVGHACAPGGEATTKSHARLALQQEGATVFDKRIEVVRAEPFERIPLIYERAAGGVGTDNPLGMDEDEDEHPQLLDPRDPRRPIGFGPIAASWPVRRRLISKEALQGLEQHPVQLPAQLDWRYFQAAPLDQQIPQLSPHATFVLEGFHPEQTTIEARLPGAVAVGEVFGLDPSAPERPHPLAFRADTVALDGDRMRCTVTWRAVLEVPAESAVPGLLVVGGVHTDAAPLTLPTERPAAVSIGVRPEPGPAAPSPDAGATMAVSSQRPTGAALPFGAAAGPPSSDTNLGAPLPFKPGARAAPAPIATKLAPATGVGATLGPGMPSPAPLGPLSPPKAPASATPPAPAAYQRVAPPPRLDGTEAPAPKRLQRPGSEEPAVPLTAAAAIGDDDAKAKVEAPAAAKPTAAEAREPAKKKPKKTPKKKVPAKRAKRQKKSGADLNALLYGKK